MASSRKETPTLPHSAYTHTHIRQPQPNPHKPHVYNISYIQQRLKHARIQIQTRAIFEYRICQSTHLPTYPFTHGCHPFPWRHHPTAPSSPPSCNRHATRTCFLSLILLSSNSPVLTRFILTGRASGTAKIFLFPLPIRYPPRHRHWGGSGREYTILYDRYI